MQAQKEALVGGVLGAVGLVASGVGFLGQSVDIRLWFLFVLLIVPSGEMLAIFRGVMYKRFPTGKKKNE